MISMYRQYYNMIRYTKRSALLIVPIYCRHIIARAQYNTLRHHALYPEICFRPFFQKPHRLLPNNLYVVLYNFKARREDELDLK